MCSNSVRQASDVMFSYKTNYTKNKMISMAFFEILRDFN